LFFTKVEEEEVISGALDTVINVLSMAATPTLLAKKIGLMIS